MNTTVEVRTEFGFPTFMQTTPQPPQITKKDTCDYRVTDADGVEEDHYEQLGAI